MTPLRVLIVEDNLDDEAMVLRALARGGYEVASVRVESARAFEEALAYAWDIVISDYHMPHFSGLTAWQFLRATRRDIPFVLVSSTLGPELEIAAAAAGIADFLPKDRVRQELIPVVERVLREAEARRRLGRAG